MDKSLNNKLSGGKPLSNTEFTFTAQQNTSSNLSDLLGSLQPSSSNVTSSGADGDKAFGALTADSIVAGEITVQNDFYFKDEDDNLLRITETEPFTVNGTLVRGVAITNSNIEEQNNDYRSIKLIVPYMHNTPDFVPDPEKSEAPDNYFEIANTKFKVSGPLTIMKSIRTVFTSPILTVSYLDKVEASIVDSEALNSTEYDRGISFEYTTGDSTPIKLGFYGYSMKKKRFVFVLRFISSFITICFYFLELMSLAAM